VIAVLAIGAAAVLVLAGLALWITPDGFDDEPYVDDLEQLERAARVRDALDRARRGDPPAVYRDGVQW
jgi:hypothetical protein